MNPRERYINTILGKPTDRGFFAGEGYWNETLDVWKSNGMPDNLTWDFDSKYFSLKINTGLCPSFEEEVLKDEGDTIIIRDMYGVIKRIRKSGTAMPQFISFPVKDRSSWEIVKEKLNPEIESRYPSHWDEIAEKSLSTTDIVSFNAGGHHSGFFGFLRELFGDAIYYAFYDDPGLIHDILDFQVYRINYYIQRLTKNAKIDVLTIWEDMCFKNGPLISPDLFREFLMQPYYSVIDTAKKCGISVIDVDSDGNIHKLIPLWLEVGVNTIHPMEVAAGMDVVEIKKQYGNQFVPRGGIDKRSLAQGPDAIDREFERVRPAFEMGGYIPAVDHAIPPNVSWQNYLYYLDKKAEFVGKT